MFIQKCPSAFRGLNQQRTEAWVVGGRAYQSRNLPLSSQPQNITIPWSASNWVWFGLLLFNSIFSTNRLYRAIAVWNISRRAGEQDKHTIEQWNNITNQENHKHYSAWASWRQSPLPWLGFFRGVFLANRLASTDNLTRTTKRQNTYQRKLTIPKRGPNI